MAWPRAVSMTVLAMLVVVACGGEAPGSAAATDVDAQPTITTSGQVTPAASVATTDPPDEPSPTASDAVDLGALDVPLVPESDLPEGFPPVPVPAGGDLDPSVGFFLEESVTYEYPSGSLPGLIAFYEAWFTTQGIDPGPTFGSDPSRYWDVMVDGERVKFELYTIEGTDRVRLSILYFE